jgi:hypothetical protein
MSYLEKIKLPMHMQTDAKDAFAPRAVGFLAIDACEPDLFQTLHKVEKRRAAEAEQALKSAGGLRLKLFGKVMHAPSVKQALGFA